MRISRIVFNKAFSLTEVLLGVFLLATAIVIITGVLISALQAINKGEGTLNATNIMLEEKSKIDQLGYKLINSSDSYFIDNFQVIYDVDPKDINAANGITNELKVISLGIYNVPETDIASTPRDRLISVKTTTVLFYKP